MTQVDAVDKSTPTPVGELVTAAWRSLGDGLRTLWPVFLAWALVAGGQSYLERLIQPPGVRAPNLLSALALPLASAFVLAVPAGMATRNFLGSETPWWRLDLNLGAYVLLEGLGLAVMTSAFSILSVLVAAGVRMDAGTTALVAVAQLIVGLAVTWAVLRLTLWPIGILMGERRLTLGYAWRNMRGAVWPYVLAGAIASVIPFAALLFFVIRYRNGGELWALAAQSLIAPLSGLLFAAVAAEIYRRRNTFGIGEVFD